MSDNWKLLDQDGSEVGYISNNFEYVLEIDNQGKRVIARWDTKSFKNYFLIDQTNEQPLAYASEFGGEVTVGELTPENKLDFSKQYSKDTTKAKNEDFDANVFFLRNDDAKEEAQKIPNTATATAAAPDLASTKQVEIIARCHWREGKKGLLATIDGKKYTADRQRVDELKKAFKILGIESSVVSKKDNKKEYTLSITNEEIERKKEVLDKLGVKNTAAPQVAKTTSAIVEINSSGAWFTARGTIKDTPLFYGRMQDQAIIDGNELSELQTITVQRKNKKTGEADEPVTPYKLDKPVPLGSQQGVKYVIEYVDEQGAPFLAKRSFTFNGRDHLIAPVIVNGKQIYKFSHSYNYAGTQCEYVDAQGQVLDKNLSLIAKDWGVFNGPADTAKIAAQSIYSGTTELMAGKEKDGRTQRGLQQALAITTATYLATAGGGISTMASAVGGLVSAAAGASFLIPVAIVVGYSLYSNREKFGFEKGGSFFDSQTVKKAGAMTATAAVTVAAFCSGLGALAASGLIVSTIIGNEMPWSNKPVTKAGENLASLKTAGTAAAVASRTAGSLATT